MQTQITPKTEQLAAQYAALKHQSKLIQQQLDKISAELLEHLPSGHAVVTPEYRVSCNPGRSQFSWICSKEEQKKIQEALVEKKVADFTVGKTYVQIRFLKQADDE